MSEDNKEVRDLMIQDAGTGFEDFESSDFVMPLLTIVQSMSPQLLEYHELYNPDAKPGRIINTKSGQVYKECRVIPCRYTFRNVEWKPRGSGGGFVASYDRESSKSLQLEVDSLTGRAMHNGNIVQQTSYYLCLLQEENYERVIIPLTSTQLKKARRWNTLMMSQKVGDHGETILPMFSHAYKLSVVGESNNKGTWFGWNISIDHEVMDSSIYQMAKTVYHSQVNFLPERQIAAIKQATDDNGAM